MFTYNLDDDRSGVPASVARKLVHKLGRMPTVEEFNYTAPLPTLPALLPNVPPKRRETIGLLRERKGSDWLMDERISSLGLWSSPHSTMQRSASLPLMGSNAKRAPPRKYDLAELDRLRRLAEAKADFLLASAKKGRESAQEKVERTLHRAATAESLRAAEDEAERRALTAKLASRRADRLDELRNGSVVKQNGQDAAHGGRGANGNGIGDPIAQGSRGGGVGSGSDGNGDGNRNGSSHGGYGGLNANGGREGSSGSSHRGGGARSFNGNGSFDGQASVGARGSGRGYMGENGNGASSRAGSGSGNGNGAGGSSASNGNGSDGSLMKGGGGATSGMKQVSGGGYGSHSEGGNGAGSFGSGCECGTSGAGGIDGLDGGRGGGRDGGRGGGRDGGDGSIGSAGIGDSDLYGSNASKRKGRAAEGNGHGTSRGANQGDGANGTAGGGSPNGRRSPTKNNKGKNGKGDDEDDDDPEAMERARLAALHIDWKALSRALPMGGDDASIARRTEIFAQWDVNSNGSLSYSEIDRAMKKMMTGLTPGMAAGKGAFFEWSRSWKPIIMRAFQQAKEFNSPRRKKRNDDYVERDEFRLLLVCIRRYFELFIAFSRMDLNSDRKIDLEEFVTSLPELQKWGIHVAEADAAEEFAVIDTNSGGSIMFDEFIHWALNKKLGLDEVDDSKADEYYHELMEGSAREAFL